MSVLIKGMEMPGSCFNCPFLDYEEGFCLADAIKHDSGWYENKFQPGWKIDGRPERCPLIPVPEHGRLIEESKVLDIVFEWCPDDDGSVGKVGDPREMLDEIEALPSIIPAELFGKTEQLADGEETE